MADTITALHEQIERMKSKDKRNTVRGKNLAHAIVRKAGVAATGAGLGALTAHGVSPDVKGFPWKLGVWLIAVATEAMTEGNAQQLAGAIGDATLAVYSHDAVANKSLVAGDGGEF